MSRTPSPIRARRGPRGSWLVAYAEAPKRWFTSTIPCAAGDSTMGRLPAITWAKRNRERLLERTPGLVLRDLMADFFEPSSPWVVRMRAKGHVFSDPALTMRAGHVANYLDPLFGDMDPRELTGRYIDDALIGAKRKGGQDLATGTKYKIVYTLNLILEDLLERQIIAANPLVGIRAYNKAPIHPRGALPRETVQGHDIPPLLGA